MSNRNAEIIGGEHELVAEEGGDGAAFFPAACGGAGGCLGDADVADSLEHSDEVEILHDRPVGEPSGVPEDLAAEEEALVAVGSSE